MISFLVSIVKCFICTGSPKTPFFSFAILLLGSCTVVKNYPKNTPFVFKNVIEVNGEVSKDEKNRLQTELINYWDDSIKVNSFLQFGVRTVIKNPNEYDSSGITRSMIFMNSYLNSQGYYNTEINVVPPTIDTVRDQYRTTIEFDINVNRHLSINSFSYNSITKPELRRIALANSDKSLLVKGKTFTKSLISAELDRLVDLYRNKGYYRFTRENIYAEVDTTDVELLELTLDPFEQARKIAEAATRRRANPTIDVLIKQRPSADSNALELYRVGKFYYYPETLISESPGFAHAKVVSRGIERAGLCVEAQSSKNKNATVARAYLHAPWRSVPGNRLL